jgi:formate hydrogenlyase transcriptional activator
LVEFDGLALILHAAAPKTMCLYLLEGLDLKANPVGVEMPAEETPAGWVVETQQPLIVADIEREGRFPRITSMLKADGIRSFCLLPLTTPMRRLGALGFGSRQLDAYTAQDIDFMRYVVRQVAVAVDNVLHSIKSVLRRVETVAATPSTVLIHGETGTGKELTALRHS